MTNADLKGRDIWAKFEHQIEAGKHIISSRQFGRIDIAPIYLSDPSPIIVFPCHYLLFRLHACEWFQLLNNVASTTLCCCKKLFKVGKKADLTLVESNGNYNMTNQTKVNKNLPNKPNLPSRIHEAKPKNSEWYNKIFKLLWCFP